MIRTEISDHIAVVTMDSHGRSLHREVFAASEAALKERV
jgi:tartrate dehydratase beta subunit/fumarate hydratase class I family protein